MNPELDPYFDDATDWKAEKAALRRIALKAGLTEEKKWHQPCYTHQGANIAIIGSYKDFVALSFLRGALIDDPEGRLVAPGENSRAARMLTFTAPDQIDAAVVTLYIDRARAVVDRGEKVDFTKGRDMDWPEELVTICDEAPEFRAAFEALTPGRQRGYLIHFSGAKQSATRTGRIEKHMDRILDGKGMHDR